MLISCNEQLLQQSKKTYEITTGFKQTESQLKTELLHMRKEVMDLKSKLTDKDNENSRINDIFNESQGSKSKIIEANNKLQQGIS